MEQGHPGFALGEEGGRLPCHGFPLAPSRSSFRNQRPPFEELRPRWTMWRCLKYRQGRSSPDLLCQISSPAGGGQVGRQPQPGFLQGGILAPHSVAHLCLLWPGPSAGLATAPSLRFANRCGWLDPAQDHSPHVLTTACRSPRLFLVLPFKKIRFLLNQEPGSVSRPEQGKPGVVRLLVLLPSDGPVLQSLPTKTGSVGLQGPCVLTGDFRDAGGRSLPPLPSADFRHGGGPHTPTLQLAHGQRQREEGAQPGYWGKAR